MKIQLPDPPRQVIVIPKIVHIDTGITQQATVAITVRSITIMNHDRVSMTPTLVP